MNDVQKLVDLMYWDYDRLSSSGQETLDKLAKLVGLPEENNTQDD
tara:strand:- start:164 stop:298 length:135 start_codon:yes stop_codon:yes gene_type:complete